jgi:hypothetical protein
MTNEIKKKAVAKATAVVAVLGSVLHFPAGMLDAVWASLGTLFPALSISAFTLGSELPAWVPVSTLETVALAAGALYVAKLLYKSYQKMEDRL